jgi:hypothetical protein
MFNILKEAADLQSGASTDSGIGIVIIWFHYFSASTGNQVLVTWYFVFGMASRTARQMFNIFKEAADLQSEASTDSGIGMVSNNLVSLFSGLHRYHSTVLGMEL